MPITWARRAAVLLIATVLMVGGGLTARAIEDYPGTAEGLRALMTAIVEADPEARLELQRALRPTAKDYAALFGPELGEKLGAIYDRAWDDDQILVGGRPGQTEMIISSATVADLKADTDEAKTLAGGWREIADMLTAGHRIHRVEFVAPGRRNGRSWGGIVHLNDRWIAIPKPWRALEMVNK